MENKALKLKKHCVILTKSAEIAVLFVAVRSNIIQKSTIQCERQREVKRLEFPFQVHSIQRLGKI